MPGLERPAFFFPAQKSPSHMISGFHAIDPYTDHIAWLRRDRYAHCCGKKFVG